MEALIAAALEAHGLKRDPAKPGHWTAPSGASFRHRKVLRWAMPAFLRGGLEELNKKINGEVGRHLAPREAS